MDMDDIYSDDILAWAANISHIGALPQANFSAQKKSRLCGSQISVTLNVQDNQIIDYAQQIQACVLGQAAAAIIADKIEGSDLQQIIDADQQFKKLIIDGEGHMQGRFEDLQILRPVHKYKARHGAVFLTFDAILSAFNQEVKG